MNVQACKFSIGDKVCIKATGLPTTGVVTAITVAKLWIHCYGNSPIRHSELWNRLYPGWEDRLVIGITTEFPQPVYTVQEIMEQSGCNEHEAKILQKYGPKQNLITYPEDDLEAL